jgi:intein/homing endonuclease
MKSKLTTEFAELVGIMFGDGCLSRSGNKYTIYISGHKINDLGYHSKITKKLFKIIFDKDVNIKFRNEENTLFIRFRDKEIFNRFKSFGVPIGKKYDQLKIPALVKKEIFFKAFLRGIFDTDGCIILSKQHRSIPYYPRIEITSKSKKFLNEILLKLKRMNFYGSISNKGRGYRLELSGFKNISDWYENIGSSHPKKAQKLAEINAKTL